MSLKLITAQQSSSGGSSSQPERDNWIFTWVMENEWCAVFLALKKAFNFFTLPWIFDDISNGISRTLEIKR